MISCSHLSCHHVSNNGRIKPLKIGAIVVKSGILTFHHPTTWSICRGQKGFVTVYFKRVCGVLYYHWIKILEKLSNWRERKTNEGLCFR